LAEAKGASGQLARRTVPVMLASIVVGGLLAAAGLTHAIGDMLTSGATALYEHIPGWFESLWNQLNETKS
jgi:hypothetical protein